MANRFTSRGAQKQRAALKAHTPTPPNPYEVLGVPPGVSEEVLKLTYYRLASQFHPDRNPAGAARMAEINVAYNSLIDVASRLKVDTVLKVKRCGKCRGSGSVMRQKGFAGKTKTKCPACGGAGTCPE